MSRLCGCIEILSTHILTRRMTGCGSVQPEEEKSFNSHPHKEDDRQTPLQFQFVCTFNSHPHKEDDHFLNNFICVVLLSTHILTRRMTAHITKNSTKL